ncbi:MAG: hypothetical protein JST39_19515 [Bacteroidetes bacterium]|nr:hypothetical protein [Bacteroidota bacterium]
MGRLISGINGPIVGKVGAVVGSSRNGKPYLKGPYKDRTTNVSEAELGNRAKFRTSQIWLKPLKEFVREGFKSFRLTSGAFLAAKSYLQRHALEGSGVTLSVNPALVKLSTGPLPLPANLTVSKTSPDQLLFSWDTEGIEGDRRYDQVMMLAYDVANGKAYQNVTGQFRTAGADILTVVLSNEEVVFHVYAAFTSGDRETQSESVYLGAITA